MCAISPIGQISPSVSLLSTSLLQRAHLPADSAQRRRLVNSVGSRRLDLLFATAVPTYAKQWNKFYSNNRARTNSRHADFQTFDFELDCQASAPSSQNGLNYRLSCVQSLRQKWKMKGFVWLHTGMCRFRCESMERRKQRPAKQQPTPKPTTKLTTMPHPTFVLIHSPLVGPLTWSLVATALRERGYNVLVPELVDDDRETKPFWRRARQFGAIPRNYGHQPHPAGGARRAQRRWRTASRHRSRPRRRRRRILLRRRRDPDRWSHPARSARNRIPRIHAGIPPPPDRGRTLPGWTADDLAPILPDPAIRRTQMIAELRPALSHSSPNRSPSPPPGRTPPAPISSSPRATPPTHTAPPEGGLEPPRNRWRPLPHAGRSDRRSPETLIALTKPGANPGVAPPPPTSDI